MTIFIGFITFYPRSLASVKVIRRTIICHRIIAPDLSNSMMDRDMRPTRFDLSLACTHEFMNEWFDQNPLGQIGIVGLACERELGRGSVKCRVCE